MYIISEPNAVSNLDTITRISDKYNFEIISLGITNASEISNGAQTLIGKGAECFCLLTDNNMADNISTLLHITDSKKIPVFARDNTQVDEGCIDTLAINYYELGKDTANMGVKILTRESEVKVLPIEIIDEYNVFEFMPNEIYTHRVIIIYLFIIIVIKVLLDLLLKTRIGLLLRAVGNNKKIINTIGERYDRIMILGLFVSNGL